MNRHWAAEVAIGEFCATGSGGTPDRSRKEFYGGDIPWVKSGELREKVILETEEHLTEAGLKSSAAKLVPAGAILVAMYGATVGRLALLGRDAATNQAVCNIRPDPSRADTRYLFRALEAKVPELVRSASGGAQPNISQEKIRNTKIKLPPLDEQRRIAAILDQADALRQKRKRAIELLDSLTQSLFQTVTTDPGVVTAQLSDALTFVTSGGRNWTQYVAEEGARFIRSFDVQNGWISNDDPVFVAAPDSAEAKRTRTQIGDVLLTITGSRIGRASALPEDLSGAYVSQHVAILRVDKSTLLPDFLSAFLISDQGQAQIAKWQYGQTKPGLNFEQIRRFKIPILPLASQERFVEQSEALAGLMSCLDRGVAVSEALFASLQHRAFSGQL